MPNEREIIDPSSRWKAPAQYLNFLVPHLLRRAQLSVHMLSLSSVFKSEGGNQPSPKDEDHRHRENNVTMACCSLRFIPWLQD